jgi:polyhydroxybutyrate depolymerase
MTSMSFSAGTEALRALLLLALLALAAPAAAAPKPGEVDWEKVTVALDDGDRAAFVERLVPERGVTPPPAPALIVLHDHGMKPERMRETARLDLAGRGWVLIYPRGWDGAWNPGRKDLGGAAEKGHDDVAYIGAVVQQLAGEGLIDPTRIFLAGFGEGGLMALRLACDSPIPWRGAAVVAATWPVGLYCGRRDPLPLILFHGVEDPAAPFHGGRVSPELRGSTTGAAASVSRLVSIAGALNGCSGYSETRLDAPADAKQRTRLRIHECRTPLVQYIVDGGGHHWPGGRPPSERLVKKYGPAIPSPDASRAIADLFESLANR